MEDAGQLKPQRTYIKKAVEIGNWSLFSCIGVIFFTVLLAIMLRNREWPHCTPTQYSFFNWFQHPGRIHGCYYTFSPIIDSNKLLDYMCQKSVRIEFFSLLTFNVLTNAILCLDFYTLCFLLFLFFFCLKILKN